ncbi:MAG: adventurous gliding motility lipoprotein CglB, partial [Myxococcaceae bacterium]
MQSAMNTFLTGPGATTARMGLAVLPALGTTAQCGTGSIIASPNLNIVQADDDASLKAQADQINQYIKGIQAGGGTPTEATLRVVGNATTLNDPNRDDLILLLTDGLPNCNESLNDATCTCVNTANGAPPCNTAKNQNCLDDVATVNRITTLKSQGIRTIVVGFGADTGTGLAAGPLNNMALAGGFARTCIDPTTNQPDAALCGAGDTCDAQTHVCGIKFYKAADGAALVAALQAITKLIGTDPCVYNLDSKPSKPELLTVSINGNTVQSGPDTWTYDETLNKVTFVKTGSVCTQIQNATPDKPVNVEFGIIESL